MRWNGGIKINVTHHKNEYCYCQWKNLLLQTQPLDEKKIDGMGGANHETITISRIHELNQFVITSFSHTILIKAKRAGGRWSDQMSIVRLQPCHAIKWLMNTPSIGWLGCCCCCCCCYSMSREFSFKSINISINNVYSATIGEKKTKQNKKKLPKW